MSSFLELQTFYEQINQVSEPLKNGIGHFNIFRVEDILLPKQKKVTYSRRSFFKVSLVTGHSRIHYGDQTIEIPETALVFTNPTIPYFWERVSEKHSGYLCIFTESFFNKSGHIRDYPVFQFFEAAVIPLSAREVSPFTDLFLKMFRELQGTYIYKYDLLRNLLVELIHEAQKMHPAAAGIAAGSNASERIASLFDELLERQFPIELNYQVIQLNTPAAFARQLNIHVNHLNKALKETTGQTTSRLISQRVFQEAKILLRSTNWTVSEIAWSLGFEEPNHFSSFFKSRAKTTPQKFRQSAID